MGRPKTKGQRITISLSLVATEAAELRAAAAGLSLKAWMESQLERALVPSPEHRATPNHSGVVTRGSTIPNPAVHPTTANRTVEPRFKP